MHNGSTIVNEDKMDIKAIRQRCKQIDELRQRELLAHKERVHTGASKRNTSQLIHQREITRRQGLLFLYGMPQAWLVAHFDKGEPPEDVKLPLK